MDIELPDTIFVHWKTTVNGLLSAGVAIVIAVMALPPTASRCVIALAVLRAVIGCLQKDAGSQLAIPAGESAPQIVASHETPDDPTSRPVA